MIKLFPAVAVCALICTVAHASIFGGSNLPLSDYSDMRCYKPSKPYKPYSFNYKWEVDSYNSSVDLYNSEMETYLGCVKNYLENCNNDIERIQEKMEEAVRKAKRDY